MGRRVKRRNMGEEKLEGVGEKREGGQGKESGERVGEEWKGRVGGLGEGGGMGELVRSGRVKK